MNARQGVCAVGLIGVVSLVHGETLQFRVNGVPLELIHGRGADARALIAIHSPEFAPAKTRHLAVADWSLRSRLDGNRSIALQLRGAGDRLEAVYSSLDVGTPPRPLPRTPLDLPLGVEVGAVIESIGASPSSQWSLRSTRPAPRVLAEIRHRAETQGWHVEAESDGALSFVRRTERLRLSFEARPVTGPWRLTLLAWSVG